MNEMAREEERLNNLKYALAGILREVVEEDKAQPTNIHEEWLAEEVIERWEKAGHNISLKTEDKLLETVRNIEDGVQLLIAAQEL